MKKAKIIALLAAASMVTLTGCKGTPDTMGGDLAEQLIEQDKAAANAGKDVDIHNFIMPEIGEKIAVINVKDYGTIKIKLFPEDAEKGVENFVGLAEMGYYDELIFHRIIPSFMNQGGDPRGDGTGGKSIWGESFDGGTDENLYHFTGAVAYANSGSTSTNGSQFYIVNTPDGYMQYSCDELMASDPSYYWPDNVVEKYNEVGGVPFLDGGYTVFGQVFEGMDVVRAMAQVETNPDTDKPLTQIMMENVEIVEYTGPSTTSSDSSVSDTAANDTADNTVEQEQAAAAVEDVEIHNFDMPENGEKIAVVNVKDFGTIKIKLFPEDAEKGVENFVGLAESGYYNGLIFHRIIPEFMNQGGDPNGNGTGGQSIWGDSFDGGTDENLYHFTGAVAYANSGATSTNGSQFYIVNTPDGYMQYSCEVLSANDPAYSWPANVVEKYNEVGGTPFLDGSYTVFGQVFEGMDVVRAMAEVETDAMDKPLTDIVIESIEIVEYTN